MSLFFSPSWQLLRRVDDGLGGQGVPYPEVLAVGGGEALLVLRGTPGRVWGGGGLYGEHSGSILTPFWGTGLYEPAVCQINSKWSIEAGRDFSLKMHQDLPGFCRKM